MKKLKLTQELVNTSLEFKGTSSSKIEFLKQRAFELQKARSFFYDKKYIEVDVPSINKYPAIDSHIDSFEVSCDNRKIGYLHTSPEYQMKKLLAMGMQKIFYIGHVFRVDESGKKHNLEFTMVEWYQVNLSFDAIINETLEFCKCFIGDKKVKRLTYFDAFYTFLGIDPLRSNKKQLINYAKENGINFSSDLDENGWLQLLFSHLIEPKLKGDVFYIIFDYPKSQAALAKTRYVNEIELAFRFEIYYDMIELANGYFELNDSDEQMKRFKNINQIRKLENKKSYPIDKKFIKAVKNLPDCSGVSVGFDRLLMLKYKQENIKNVIFFPYTDF